MHQEANFAKLIINAFIIISFPSSCKEFICIPAIVFISTAASCKIENTNTIITDKLHWSYSHLGNTTVYSSLMHFFIPLPVIFCLSFLLFVT